MDREIQEIIGLLERVYEKDAWHGPSVQESLKNISQEQAFSHVENAHSIIELVAHMTSWKIYVLHMLKGDATYKVDEHHNFPAAQDWSRTVGELAASQQALIETLRIFHSAKLKQQAPGQYSHLTFYTLLHGIIHHDLYHTGQIMLIKKAAGIQTI